jgi:putative phage-type endonuclease
MTNIDRRTYISSTEVAAILGLSDYKETPYSVWERKVHDVPDKEETDIMRWGKLLEPVIISELERTDKIKVVNNNKFYSDPEYPFLATHPDGEHEYVDGIRNNEIKTVASWAYRNWESDCPNEYYCQIQYTLGITKRKSCLFTVFEMDARKTHNKEIFFDPEFYAKLKEFMIYFWTENVVKSIPPDYSVEDYKRMINIFDDYNEVDVSVIHDIKKYRLLEQKLEKTQSKIDQMKENLQMKIGEKSGIRYGIDILATWKPQSKITIDAKMLKELAPLIYEQCKKVSNFRVLRIKERK